MKAILLGFVVLVFAATPVLAADCHGRQVQIDKTFGKRFDRQASTVRSIAMQGQKLCKSGKDADAQKRYDEAMKAGGLTVAK